MKILSIDFETFSTADVADVGAPRYAADPSTDAWCLAYALPGEEPAIWWRGDPFPALIRDHLATGGSLVAWNASFESAMWPVLVRRYGWPAVPLDRFLCSAALAARAGLPRKLEDAAKVLGLAQQKDLDGHALMLRLCRPVDYDGVRPIWATPSPDEIARLRAYCAQDVRTEQAVLRALPPVGHPLERRLFHLDQQINQRGVRIDRALVQGSLTIAAQATHAINETLRATTQGAVTKATQVQRIKSWVEARGVTPPDLAKATLRDLLASDTLDPTVRSVLLLRQQGGKSSVAKLKQMLACAGPDDRVRGLLRYYGATTGRWAGQLVQPQNFPRPLASLWSRGGEFDVEAYEADVRLLRTGDWQAADCLTPPGVTLMDLLASMLRGCFVAAEGHEFVAADFAAIEARVLAWLAGAAKLLESYRTGGSAYLDMSEVIFGRRVSKKADPFEYQVSKNTVLGCGYQMGADRFREQMQEQTGVWLDVDLCQRAVSSYRGLYHEVPLLWRGMNSTVQAVVGGQVGSWTDVPSTLGKIAFRIDPSGWLTMRLPSGRSLWYPAPRLSQRKAPWGDMVPCVTTACVHPETKQWTRQALYGGLLTENAVQAIARDLMGEAMFRVEAAGYPVVLSVHDELVTEPVQGHGSVDEFCALMATPPAWAADCPIAAEGWRGTRYRK